MKKLSLLSLFLVNAAVMPVCGQKAVPCMEEVLTILEDNPVYQQYIDEGSQSGVYKAGKMMMLQTLRTCGTSLSSEDKASLREQIAQMDEMINALKDNGNGLRFDFSTPPANAPKYADQPPAPSKAPAKTYVRPKSSGGAMTSGSAY